VTLDAAPDGARVRLELQGPPLELRYVQSVPPGAREPRLVEGAEPRAASFRAGPHDGALEVRLRLEEGTPRTLRFAWRGGLAVEPPAPRLRPGQRSRGLRVVDFHETGGTWRLTLEGEGGRTYRLDLFGEAVRVAAAETGAGRGAGADAGARARVTGRDDTRARTTLEVTFPGAGERIPLTLTLERTR